MKCLLASFFLMISVGAFADPQTVSLDKGDFTSAQPVRREGDLLVEATLSKHGLAKFKKLNETSVERPVHMEIDGVKSDFKLREPIRTEKLQMGPYSEPEARKVSDAINGRAGSPRD